MATTRSQAGSVGDPALYVALELSKKEWKLGLCAGFGREAWVRTVASGDFAALDRVVARGRHQFGLPAHAPVVLLPRIAELLRPPVGKPLVALVKPQFEVGRELVGKGGVVREEAARRGAVDKVRTWAVENGFTAHEDVESPITGPAGNVEYLLLLRTAERAR